MEKSSHVLQNALQALQEETLARILSGVATLLDDAHSSPSLVPAVVSVQAVDGMVTPVSHTIAELERKRRESAYDTYMVYAQADEEEVMKIGKQLKEQGILVHRGSPKSVLIHRLYS